MHHRADSSNAEQFVHVHGALRAQPRPDTHSVQSIENWLWNRPGAIDERETDFLIHREDLMGFGIQSKPPLWRGCYRVLKCWYELQIFPVSWGLKSIHTTVAKMIDKSKHSPAPDLPYPDVHQWNDARIDRFICGLLHVLGFAMLIAPLWVLSRTQDTQQKLGVISGFLFLFVLLVLILTVSKPLELLAATAA